MNIKPSSHSQSEDQPGKVSAARGWMGFRVALLAGLALGLGVWLWHLCFRAPDIRFLPPGGDAQWIVCPEKPSLKMLRTSPEYVFRHEFPLVQAPDHAVMAWRFFGAGRIWINGQSMPLPPENEGCWKDALQMDVAGALRAGTNEIRASVSNYMAPPALWLEMDACGVKTGTNWEVCPTNDLRFAAWLPGRPGETIRSDMVREDETLGLALRRSGWVVALMLAVGIGAAAWLQRVRTVRLRWVVVAVAGLTAWSLLIWHNSRQFCIYNGFDSVSHQQYVKYIQTRHHLPDATEGFMMYQPPLYYIIAANWLDFQGMAAVTPEGAKTLRLLSIPFGLAQVLLVFACLRLLFPQRLKYQLAGAGLAALLPAHLNLLHYATNETLAAALVTASIYATLRAIRHEHPASVWHWVAGLLFGLAMLAKVSAVIAAPFVFGAMVWRLVERREFKVQYWLAAVGVPIILAVLICGPFYWRLTCRFGSPLCGNWDAAVHPAWWQYPGCRAMGYYLSFGQSLSQPLFSGLYSFGDAMYSTLWADGLCGGSISQLIRPAWNYDLMTLGCWLALVPTVVVVTGFVRLVVTWVKKPRLDWGMMAGLLFAGCVSLVYISLRVPCYTQKAFYALAALLPFCACGAAGLEYLGAKGRGVRIVLWGLLIAWALNVVATFWLRRPVVIQ